MDFKDIEAVLKREHFSGKNEIYTHAFKLLISYMISSIDNSLIINYLNLLDSLDELVLSELMDIKSDLLPVICVLYVKNLDDHVSKIISKASIKRKIEIYMFQELLSNFSRVSPMENYLLIYVISKQDINIFSMDFNKSLIIVINKQIEMLLYSQTEKHSFHISYDESGEFVSYWGQERKFKLDIYFCILSNITKVYYLFH
jgi:hypothetical protein